jgi:hypothetical protein
MTSAPKLRTSHCGSSVLKKYRPMSMPTTQPGAMRTMSGTETKRRDWPRMVADEAIVSSVQVGTSSFIGTTSAISGIAAKPPKPVLPRNA